LRNEEQNPVARVALNDFFVAAHSVEDLWTQPHVADRADPLTRFRDRQAVSPFRHQIKEGEDLGIHRADERGALGMQLFELGLESTVFCSVARAASAFLTPAVKSSASTISSRILSSIDLISACAKAISCWIAWYS
jgi:hypothetical protein